MQELVILVNEENQPTGTIPKAEVHHSQTPLHRGFSLFIFNAAGQLLLQQRCSKKVAFPLVWSNSCCGHPLPEEANTHAALRRADYELGIGLEEIVEILPDYRYRAEMHGIVENEFCSVMVSFTEKLPKHNEDEVESTRWLSWNQWLQEVKKHPESYSPWCVEETLLLEESPLFQAWYLRNIAQENKAQFEKE